VPLMPEDVFAAFAGGSLPLQQADALVLAAL
jgi:hypothetical protein